jgi:hypothetical protein
MGGADPRHTRWARAEIVTSSWMGLPWLGAATVVFFHMLIEAFRDPMAFGPNANGSFDTCSEKAVERSTG